MSAQPRRTFLKAINVAVGGVIAAVFAVPGLRALLFPAWPASRRVVEGPEGFLPVASASAVERRLDREERQLDV
jgi:hypothetical protein